MIEVKEETRYRSVPQVNQSDDMVRVTLTCTWIEYHRLKRLFDHLNDEKPVYTKKPKVCQFYDPPLCTRDWDIIEF